MVPQKYEIIIVPSNYHYDICHSFSLLEAIAKRLLLRATTIAIAIVGRAITKLGA